MIFWLFPVPCFTVGWVPVSGQVLKMSKFFQKALSSARLSGLENGISADSYVNSSKTTFFKYIFPKKNIYKHIRHDVKSLKESARKTFYWDFFLLNLTFQISIFHENLLWVFNKLTDEMSPIIFLTFSLWFIIDWIATLSLLSWKLALMSSGLTLAGCQWATVSPKWFFQNLGR